MHAATPSVMTPPASAKKQRQHQQHLKDVQQMQQMQHMRNAAAATAVRSCIVSPVNPGTAAPPRASRGYVPSWSLTESSLKLSNDSNSSTDTRTSFVAAIPPITISSSTGGAYPYVNSSTADSGNTSGSTGTRDTSSVGSRSLSRSPLASTFSPALVRMSPLVLASANEFGGIMVPAQIPAPSPSPTPPPPPAQTKLEAQSNTIYCTAAGVVGPDGPHSIVKRNGKYLDWVLKLGTKQRNVIGESLGLSYSDKAELVTESRRLKHKLAQKTYLEKEMARTKHD